MEQLLSSISDFIYGILQGRGVNISLPIIKVTIVFSTTGGLSAFLFKLVPKFFTWLMKKKNIQKHQKDLHPYFTKEEIAKATKYYIETNCQNIPPSREHEPRQTHALATKEKLIPFFIDKVFQDDLIDHRFYIILADSGMGKTTFLINLYLNYCSFWGNKYKIKLLPLGAPNVGDELEKLDDHEKKNTILLLDAFDEDPLAAKDYRQRIDDIIVRVWAFRKVIITCRTQFFPYEEEEPVELKIKKFGGDGGYHSFKKLYVSPFDDKDISNYLKKKYKIWEFRKVSLSKSIIKSSPDLMVRPMLLNYIDDLIEEKNDYRYSCDVYKVLIDKWIKRESSRVLESERINFENELYKFSREIALYILSNYASNLSLYINGSDIKPFAEKHNIKLDVLELKSRSLLNRDANAHYKFSHQYLNIL